MIAKEKEYCRKQQDKIIKNTVKHRERKDLP